MPFFTCLNPLVLVLNSETTRNSELRNSELRTLNSELRNYDSELVLVNTPEFIVRYKIALLELSNKLLERALQLIVTLTDNMIDDFCADAFCLFNSLVARRLTLLLPKSKNPDMQVLRDKLVLDLARTMF